jgi:NAD(P)-dependent dehydrogenase (short-subunit alcohol dehydrogenase family)
MFDEHAEALFAMTDPIAERVRKIGGTGAMTLSGSRETRLEASMKDHCSSESNRCLRGKVAVVTGAARGIGRASAVALAREGADIVGIDICAPVYPPSGVTASTQNDLEETAVQVRAAGRCWLGLTVDQRNLPALRAAGARIEQELGGMDILFANAGIQAFKPLLEMDDADWDVQITNDLTGTANAIRAFGPYLVKRGSGRIIVTASTQGRHGAPPTPLPNGESLG